VEKIMTRAYGEVEVPENSDIVFKKEIFGFPSSKHYYLLEMKDLPNFFWLQSKEEEDLAFVVVDPRMFKEDYELSFDESDRELLELEEGDDIVDFVIANIPEDPADMTINILGPVIINVNKRLAIQAVSSKNEYTTRYPVFEKHRMEKVV